MPEGSHLRRNHATANRAARALGSRPIATAIAYTVVGVFPLYPTAAQSVRLQEELGFSRTRFGLVVGSFYLVSAVASKMIGPVSMGIGFGCLQACLRGFKASLIP